MSCVLCLVVVRALICEYVGDMLVVCLLCHRVLSVHLLLLCSITTGTLQSWPKAGLGLLLSCTNNNITAHNHQTNNNPYIFLINHTLNQLN